MENLVVGEKLHSNSLAGGQTARACQLVSTTIVYNLEAEDRNVTAELKKRLFFWKRNKSRLVNLPAEQLRHIIAESDHISAAVDSTAGWLKPEDRKRLKALTRTLAEIDKRSK